MSYAKKCDRCGKCFDPLQAEGEFCLFGVPTIYTAKNVKELTKGETIKPGYRADDMFDLCEDCTKAFKIFMKPAENGGDTDGDKKTHYANFVDIDDALADIFRISLFGGGGK